MLKHNKKRNVGLINEFFARFIASAFIDNRHEDIDKASRIWKKYVNSKTELYKELVLFNALHESSFKNKEIAFSLLEKVRALAKTQSQEKLDKEKSALISEISAALRDSKFFDREVPNYKSIASVQLLMNAWRGVGFKGKIEDLASISNLEENVLVHMLKNKSPVLEEASQLSPEDVDGLVVKIMNSKFNKKYSEILNEEQKKIVNLFVFSGQDAVKKQELLSILESIRTETLELLKKETLKEGIDRGLKKKLIEIRGLLEAGEYKELSSLNDDTISFYMTVSKLKEEMVSK